MKTVLITGGLSGIGAGLVKHYVEQGMQVAIFDLPQPETFSDEIAAWLDTPNIHYVAVNMANQEEVELGVQNVLGTWGAPDLVINCAGILRAGLFEHLCADDFAQSFAVNVLGSRHLAAACLPVMQPGAQFAFVASMAGTVGIYGYSAYGASKFAVLGLAQCLRAEYAPKGIAISAICPPEIDTPKVVEECRTMHPATRLLKDFAGRLTLDEALPQIIRGIERRRFMIIPGKLAKCTFWLNRLTPVWLHNLVIDQLIKIKLRP
jgi:NAD(P)-dependent dehydrogenase (short-subunit alcohol dehydrogenase family)